MSVSSLEQQADHLAGARDFAGARVLLFDLVAADPENFGAWLKLSAMTAATGDRTAALAALSKALELRPLDFTALLLRATHLDALGRSTEAGEAFGRALTQAPNSVPASMQPMLATAEQRYADWQTQQAKRLCAAVTAATPLTKKLERLITNSLHMTEPDRNGPTHYCYPGLPETPFHPEHSFAWLPDLEGAADIIQTEFETAVSTEAAELVPYIQYPDGVPLDQWATLNNNRDWTAIHLIQNGRQINANARHCPQLMALLKHLPQPEIKGAGPNAMFSLLAPGAHIPPHTGISNARLVCHLPLIVPEGCWFRVANDTRFWQRGKAWIFDDTIEHEALNPSATLRVILIIDIWHPALDAEERKGIAAIIEAGGQLHGL
jgi:tetratricopeptide (TPR) repeat protein